jgi:hypothetical protein
VNRWVAYQFIRNVYELWMPGHFERLLSAIDNLPDMDGLTSQHKPFLNIRRLSTENLGIGLTCESEPGDALTQEVTPSTSTAQLDAKRPRKDST